MEDIVPIISILIGPKFFVFLLVSFFMWLFFIVGRPAAEFYDVVCSRREKHIEHQARLRRIESE